QISCKPSTPQRCESRGGWEAHLPSTCSLCALMKRLALLSRLHVQDLEASFAWAPPLSTEPRDADDLLAGPESISPDDIAAEFAALEELKKTEEVHNVNEVEVLEGNAVDFDELDRVEQGIISQVILDEVEVVNYNGDGGGWDERLEFCHPGKTTGFASFAGYNRQN
ncbi:hypothetical protein DFJ58DRAFT_891850, partial [Suillus subalutaceus]|uniref:uncharacterized protein n=1 Tax=Suillus subalutaceus TaxID=48586 RepID=UPI001B86C727